jgi:hypothetical protein
MPRRLTKQQLLEILRNEIAPLVQKDSEVRQAVFEILRDAGVATKDDIQLILQEINKQRKESEKRWEENNKRWEENQKRWEENNKRWEENQKRWEENNKRWEESNKRMDGIIKEIKQLREEFAQFSKKLYDYVSAIGSRWGPKIEESIRNALSGILQKWSGQPVVIQKWKTFDKDCRVRPIPSTVEVDVVVRDTLHILCEIKAHISDGDVTKFYNTMLLYKELHKDARIEMIIVSPDPSSEAIKLAKEIGIAVYTHLEAQP